MPFGARAIGLGGATVALPPDAGGALDNPAMASKGTVRVSVSGGLSGADSGGFLDDVKTLSGTDLTALSNGADARDALAAFRNLAAPGSGLLGSGRLGAGVLYSGYAIGLTEWAWSGVQVVPDLVHVATGTNPATSWRNNATSLRLRSLRVTDLSLAWSYSMLSGALSVGVAGHGLRGTTTSRDENAFTFDTTNPFSLAREAFTGVDRTRTRFSIDAGALVTVGVLRVGGVVKAINRPSFPFDEETAPIADRGKSVTLGRQARVGASVKVPVIGILVAADLDLTTADTLVDGLKSREAGGGVEWTITLFTIRGGVSVNLEAPDKEKTFSAGVGFGLGPVHVDAAGTFRTNRNALGAVVSARLGI